MPSPQRSVSICNACVQPSCNTCTHHRWCVCIHIPLHCQHHRVDQICRKLSLAIAHQTLHPVHAAFKCVLVGGDSSEQWTQSSQVPQHAFAANAYACSRHGAATDKDVMHPPHSDVHIQLYYQHQQSTTDQLQKLKGTLSPHAHAAQNCQPVAE